MNSPVDEIKNKLDIIDVIGGYLKLTKAGKDYKAKCPFHSEKTPSFFVSPSKQIWHCFGCGAGGDMFSFVMQMEGVEFIDALRILAKRAGVTLKKQDPKLKNQRSKLYEICQEAADFFEENLKKNKKVQQYLKNRGLNYNTLKEFKVGYSLDSWDLLYSHLTELGYKEKDIEQAGLIVKKQKVKHNQRAYYDRFRRRIIFPLFNISGQIVGFTGRIFGKGESIAKYVNSPETPIFNKGQLLYGLDKAKVDIRKQNQCILVEGQMDVLMSCQSGVKNVVATSGTALTLDHLRIIKRYTENLLLAFDTDTAGEVATKKSIGLAQQLEFNVNIIILPQGKDPADIASENPKKWEQAIKKAKPAMEFYFNTAFSKYDPKKLEHKRLIAKELLPAIKKIANEIEKGHWIQILSSKLNIEEKLLMQALNRVKTAGEGREVTEASQSKKNTISLRSRMQTLEENLLGLLLKHPQHLDIAKKELKEIDFTKEMTRKIFKELKSRKSNKININQLQKKILSNQPYYLDHIIFQIEHYDLEEEDILKEINFCIKELKSNRFKKELSKISSAIKGAEEENNKREKEKLTKKFNNLSKKLINL